MPLYAGKYAICTFLQNMRNMLRSHDRYKLVSLVSCHIFHIVFDTNNLLCPLSAKKSVNWFRAFGSLICCNVTLVYVMSFCDMLSTRLRVNLLMHRFSVYICCCFFALTVDSASEISWSWYTQRTLWKCRISKHHCFY